MNHKGIKLYCTGLLLLICLFAGGCASIPLDYPKNPSTVLPPSDEARLGARIKPQIDSHHGQSGFYLIYSGMAAFESRAFLIDAADRSLDLQYYIFRDDITGTLLLDRLLAAADRGVRVRLLLDDWNITGRDYHLDLLDSHPRIEVRVFNPFGGYRSLSLSRMLQYAFGDKRLQKRMHNKAFIVDNAMAIVGGRNIGDEYFNARSDVNFADMDIIVAGPVISEISAAFDEYWNSEYAIPIKAVASIELNEDDFLEARGLLEANRKKFKDSEYAKRLKESDFLTNLTTGKLPMIWTQGEYIFDKPGKISSSIKDEPSAYVVNRLIALTKETEKERLLISPYFVPGKTGMQRFKEDRERGISVKVLTNSLASNDVKAAHSGYMKYREDLLRMGVRIYEMKPTSEEALTGHRRERKLGSSSQGALHAKTFVSDRKRVFIGSFNYDPRSALLDTQDGMLVQGPEMADHVARIFEEGASPDAAYEVTLESDSPKTEGNAPSEGRLTWITRENGEEVRYYHEPMTSLWQRIKARVFSWFVPEEML